MIARTRLLWVLITGSLGPQAPDPPEVLRVLFIGNSLTASNDLPAIVQAMAKADHKKPLVFKSMAVPGFSLEDHLDRGEAQRAIAKGKWDVVVLQQGPSALEESRIQLVRDTRRFNQLIRRAGAKTALYMVWPSTERAQDFERVCESYRLAAADVDGMLFPAGGAWLAAWRHDPKLALYSPDGLHPTVVGSYLAALVIYEKLYESTPIGLPPPSALAPRRFARINLSKKQLEDLQKSAAEADAAELGGKNKPQKERVP